MRLIDANVPNKALRKMATETRNVERAMSYLAAILTLEDTPTVEVVELEKYNDLREAFVDFVCSGVHNPAPYCKNACDECVDERGWCTYRRCNGFNPDGERRSGDGQDGLYESRC